MNAAVAAVLAFALGLGAGFWLGRHSSGTPGNPSAALTPTSMAAGILRTVRDNVITLDGGWEIEIDGNTRIVKREQKSAEAFQQDVAKYQAILAKDPTAKAPLPYSETSIRPEDLKVGMFLNVDLAKAIQPGRVRAADVREISVLPPSPTLAPSSAGSNPNLPAPAAASTSPGR